MELHSSNIGPKKIWNILRMAFFMMRKGLTSKPKQMLDMNLMLQKRGKIFGKSLENLTFHHHHRRNTTAPNGHTLGLHEYEFSCTNTPNPIFFRVNSKRKHSYFPCIGARVVDEDTDHQKGPLPVTVLPRIENSPQFTPSPFSVRISNFSTLDEGDGTSCEVDSQAEEFIKRFYQQLLAQGF